MYEIGSKYLASLSIHFMLKFNIFLNMTYFSCQNFHCLHINSYEKCASKGTEITCLIWEVCNCRYALSVLLLAATINNYFIKLFINQLGEMCRFDNMDIFFCEIHLL